MSLHIWDKIKVMRGGYKPPARVHLSQLLFVILLCRTSAAAERLSGFARLEVTLLLNQLSSFKFIIKMSPDWLPRQLFWEHVIPSKGLFKYMRLTGKIFSCRLGNARGFMGCRLTCPHCDPHQEKNVHRKM